VDDSDRFLLSVFGLLGIAGNGLREATRRVSHVGDISYRSFTFQLFKKPYAPRSRGIGKYESTMKGVDSANVRSFFRPFPDGTRQSA
jgi:hypothetical protein